MANRMTDLTDHEGQNIKEICDAGFVDNQLNHCAHFVSHVLGLTFGQTCYGMTGKGKTRGNIRVDEIFLRCPIVGRWGDGRTPSQGLLFVTDSRNVDLEKKFMEKVPQKHIGIYIGGDVWHYSNSKDKVVRQTVTQFSKHYPGNNIALFYGSTPV